MENTYRITRFFEDGDKELVSTGLTLEEAREHCQDPETSSRTCTSAVGIALTRQRGNWFDGFDEE